MKYYLTIIVISIIIIFAIFIKVEPVNDERIWCYVKTVETLDGISLMENERVMYTLGGIDIFKKCE